MLKKENLTISNQIIEQHIMIILRFRLQQQLDQFWLRTKRFES